MNLSEWQLESEAAEQADKQTDRHLSHEHLAEEPHGEVHVVVLHGEVVPVEGHVEQVGHEGDLGDGGPQAPGQEGDTPRCVTMCDTVSPLAMQRPTDHLS